MTTVRVRLVAAVAVGAAVVLGAAGCGTTPETSSRPSTAASPSPTGSVQPTPRPEDNRIPVAEAGGLCKLLTYDMVEETLGARFDVAAGGTGGSCALQVKGHPYPDLTLTAAATEANAKQFSGSVPPDGADSVDGLGKAAYRAVLGGEDGSGPRAEVGWLAGKKIYILRYSHEKGVSKKQAKQTAVKLVALAKRLKTG